MARRNVALNTRMYCLLMQHAKRLYPLLISAKAQIEWGYSADTSGSDNEDTYVVVDKSVLDEASAGIEKLIGFEGVPDPATGFYCVRIIR
jgi:hypothetical protein